tara:strand:+ start:2180 stop:3220 length:1041 start_codon:yes stop_codon:yes gene_type:complete
MKVSIGTNIKEGPWGGGNLFAINLGLYLVSKDHEVVNNLDDDDIDIILITEPRKTSESSAYTHLEVKNYLNYVNPGALVAHRINECDERKGTNFVNKYLIQANGIADYTIFVSGWLKKLYLEQGLSEKNNHVILAGANKKIFNSKNKALWKNNSKLKIVTHHWGANWNKGFSIYKKIDELLDEDSWKNKIEFTYIGNLPNKFKFQNTKHISPLSGEELSRELKTNHVYLTGSLNEPSGNHHIEGAQCGLPVMFINSGGVIEYCKDFGIEYNPSNLEEKLEYIIKNYDDYQKKMIDYPFNSDAMCRNFLDLFKNMIDNKDSILSSRTQDKGSYFNEKIYKAKRKLNW